MLNKYLPYSIFKRLFGDRRQFGLMVDLADQEFITLSEHAWDLYKYTQRGVADRLCSWEYSVVERVNFVGTRVVEVGPGTIRHLQYMPNPPCRYTLCDIRSDVLEAARKQLVNANIPCETVLLHEKTGAKLPFPDESFDVIISFNSLEHLYPLDQYLVEMKRVLSRRGQLVGGIPCEGGLAWGLGRFLTTRRYVHKHYKINYDKIICWEHPNFADSIIRGLDNHFERQYLKRHPFPLFPIDFNLVSSFVYQKTDVENR